MRVHDSQAYRKMDVTRERISRILELREILHPNWVQPCQCYCCLCYLGEYLRLITEPRYLKLVTVSSFFVSIHFDLCVDATGVVCQLGLLGTDLHAVGCGQTTVNRSKVNL